MSAKLLRMDILNQEEIDKLIVNLDEEISKISISDYYLELYFKTFLENHSICELEEIVGDHYWCLKPLSYYLELNPEWFI